MPTNDRFVEVDFPSKGLNLLAEFQEQSPLTTVDSQNVRTLNPDSLRARGGSRGGLSRYVLERLGIDTALDMTIQSLYVIVDPQAPGLGQNFHVPGDDWIEDPLNPGTFVPPGGWGLPGATEEEEEEVAFVQAKGEQVDSVGPIQVSVTFDSAVTIDNDVFLFVATTADTAGCEVAVVNNVGTALTQVGGYLDQEQLAASNIFVALSLWRIRATAVGNTTLKVTPTIDAGVSMGALEYSGLLNPGPLDDTAENEDPALAPANMTTGNLLIGFDGDLAIAGFANELDGTVGWTPGAPATSRVSLPQTVDGPMLRVSDRFPVDTISSPIEMTGQVDGGDTPYVALGASFKKAT